MRWGILPSQEVPLPNEWAIIDTRRSLSISIPILSFLFATDNSTLRYLSILTISIAYSYLYHLLMPNEWAIIDTHRSLSISISILSFHCATDNSTLQYLSILTISIAHSFLHQLLLRMNEQLSIRIKLIDIDCNTNLFATDTFSYLSILTISNAYSFCNIWVGGYRYWYCDRFYDLRNIFA
jgi:hypothetical protein